MRLAMGYFEGTSGGEAISGTSGNDTIIGNGGADTLDGWAGDDYVETLGATGLTDVNGQNGNDVLVASVPGAGQVHMRGGRGFDTLVMDLTNLSGLQSHHAYGGLDGDRFVFRNVDSAAVPTLGRIDDFDAAQDSLWIEDTELDLTALPDGIDVVLYLDQQWLRLSDTVLFALEGARDGGAERHFSEWPENIHALPVVDYVDQVNFVPLGAYESALPELVLVEVDGVSFTGGATHDLIEAGKDDTVIDGGAGNDVINAGKGHDTVLGGEGDDRIAGGMDMDWLEGGLGHDTIYGGSEADVLIGGAGDDELHGGTGGDLIYGDEAPSGDMVQWISEIPGEEWG